MGSDHLWEEIGAIGQVLGSGRSVDHVRLPFGAGGTCETGNATPNVDDLLAQPS
jgi:hypothetical protein